VKLAAGGSPRLTGSWSARGGSLDGLICPTGAPRLPDCLQRVPPLCSSQPVLSLPAWCPSPPISALLAAAPSLVLPTGYVPSYVSGTYLSSLRRSSSSPSSTVPTTLAAWHLASPLHALCLLPRVGHQTIPGLGARFLLASPG
jgi:hypothetical protein